MEVPENKKKWTPHGSQSSLVKVIQPKLNSNSATVYLV